MKKGEKVLYRMETAYTAVTETDGSKQTTKGTSLTICDGEFTYTYSDTNGAKSAMKQQAQAPVGGGVDQSYFDTMAQTYNLELLPDAEVGSYSTYVIRAVPKQSSATMEGEQLLYFDKATGVMVKSVAKNTDGKVTMESTTTDLKIDPAISADRFVFKAPEGVTLMDLTQPAGSTEQPAEEAQPDDSAQPSAESETRTEEPTEEPKEEPAKKKKKEKKSKFPKLPKKKWP
jgi:outer membrane lipoprotein-sorting protein